VDFASSGVGCWVQRARIGERGSRGGNVVVQRPTRLRQCTHPR
jgi:hypothetical protein